jgi:phosphoenolpyruvate carboxylase
MKIPTTMFTQHPDHVTAPFWESDPFISSQQELLECYHSFHTFAADECMWDFEGKFADPQVFEKLVRSHTEFFLEHAIGQEFRITVRVPNVRSDPHGRSKLMTAFSCLVASAALAEDVGIAHKPLFELILPMTKSAGELLELKQQFLACAASMHASLGTPAWQESEVRVIPLVEETRGFRQLEELLREYLHLHYQAFGTVPTEMRPFLAHSDTALSSGLISTVLSIKLALDTTSRVTADSLCELSPILGTGSLPFRGGLRPSEVAAVCAEYPGVRTWTVQSAFRYDYAPEEVHAAVGYLKAHSNQEAVWQAAAQRAILACIAERAEQLYAQELLPLVPIIQQLAPHMPSRRERMKSTGLLSYSRAVNAQALPRAITFTGVLYSLGLPPELLGVGRLIQELGAEHPGWLPILLEQYQRFFSDMRFALAHYDADAVKRLALHVPEILEIQEGVTVLEDFLKAAGVEMSANPEHRALCAQVAECVIAGKLEGISPLLYSVAATRKALG